jgi:Phage integrase family
MRIGVRTVMEKGERPGPKAKGDRRYGRPVGAKSVRNYIGYLSALLGFAQRKGWLPVNVARHIELPGKPESAEIRFLEPLGVRALADAAVDGAYREIDRAMYLTAAMTGLRQGELVALRWRDVDWAAGRIRVRQNYVLGEFGTPKSRRSTRSVPMADEVAGELDRLSRAAGESSGDALVFADPHTAGPLDKAAILRRFRRALKAAQLEQSHQREQVAALGDAYRAQLAGPRVDVAEDVVVCRLQVGEVEIAGNETPLELRYADSAECRLALRKLGRVAQVEKVAQHACARIDVWIGGHRRNVSRVPA